MNHEPWTAERIKALRTSLSLTQSEAGARLGVSTATWCQWERGQQTVRKPFQILLTLLARGTLDEFKPVASLESETSPTLGSSAS